MDNCNEIFKAFMSNKDSRSIVCKTEDNKTICEFNGLKCLMNKENNENLDKLVSSNNFTKDGVNNINLNKDIGDYFKDVGFEIKKK